MTKDITTYATSTGTTYEPLTLEKLQECMKVLEQIPDPLINQVEEVACHKDSMIYLDKEPDIGYLLNGARVVFSELMEEGMFFLKYKNRDSQVINLKTGKVSERIKGFNLDL